MGFSCKQKASKSGLNKTGTEENEDRIFLAGKQKIASIVHATTIKNQTNLSSERLAFKGEGKERAETQRGGCLSVSPLFCMTM